MGGFHLTSKISNQPVTHQILDGFQLAGQFTVGMLARIPDVSTEEIQDKSKTDAFARGLALVQCFWLLLELIARWNESLPS